MRIKNILKVMTGLILLLLGAGATYVSGYFLFSIVQAIVETMKDTSSNLTLTDCQFALLLILLGISSCIASLSLFILPAITLLSERFSNFIQCFERKKVILTIAGTILVPFIFLALIIAECSNGLECSFVQ